LSCAQQLEEHARRAGLAAEPGDGGKVNRSHLVDASVVALSCTRGVEIIAGHYREQRRVADAMIEAKFCSEKMLVSPHHIRTLSQFSVPIILGPGTLG
jgi:hypothetical protein